MAGYVMKMFSVGNTVLRPCWLKSFDPEAGTNMFSGDVVLTENCDEAMVFESFIAGKEMWQTQSKRLPFRPDGKPNKPLTAFTIEIEALPA